MSRIVKYAFRFSVLVAALCFIFDYSFLRFGDDNYHWCFTTGDFRSLGQAVSKRYVDGETTLEELEKLQNIDDFAVLVTPLLEQPSVARFDNKGQPLLFNRQEFDDRVVLTVRSTIEYKKRRFWHKDRQLAMEITVSRDQEMPLQIKQLWQRD